MYNLRYHIASLVGVFLALALGLVLGGLVVGRGTLDRQQEGLVGGLRREFATLRTENADLTEQNEVLRAFATQMTDDWVTDRLVGRTVVVMGNSGREDGRRAAQDAIASAVVDLAAPDGEADPVAIGVAAAFPDDAPAMGAQTPSRDTGVAIAADAAGIAGFDTLGTEVGRFTLVALLSGAERGLYGLLDGAQAPFPAIPGE